MLVTLDFLFHALVTGPGTKKEAIRIKSVCAAARSRAVLVFSSFVFDSHLYISVSIDCLLGRRMLAYFSGRVRSHGRGDGGGQSQCSCEKELHSEWDR